MAVFELKEGSAGNAAAEWFEPSGLSAPVDPDLVRGGQTGGGAPIPSTGIHRHQPAAGPGAGTDALVRLYEGYVEPPMFASGGGRRPRDGIRADTQPSVASVNQPSEMATCLERIQVAQQNLFRWRDKAQRFIESQRYWLTENWSDFVMMTAGNPTLKTEEGVLRAALSNAVGNFITESGSGIIKRGSAALASTLVGTAMAPGVGTIIGFIIGVMTETAASILFDMVFRGKDDAANARTQAARETGRRISNMHTNFSVASGAAQAELQMSHRFLATQLLSDCAPDQIDQISSWASAELAATPEPIAASDGSLSRELLRQWGISHATSPSSPASDVRPNEWMDATSEVYGKPGLHGEIDMFVTGLRSGLLRIGVRGSAVDRRVREIRERIAELSLCVEGDSAAVDISTMAKRVRAEFHNNPLCFRDLDDPDAFIEAMPLRPDEEFTFALALSEGNLLITYNPALAIENDSVYLESAKTWWETEDDDGHFHMFGRPADIVRHGEVDAED